MRVSAQSFFNESVSTLQRLQSELNTLQQQVASGRRIQRPSDDPLGTARALNLREAVGAYDQFERNTNIGSGRLQLQEQTLTDVTSLLQRARELTLQAGNATQNNETRGFIATELRQLLDATLALANTRDNNDLYLFSGFQTSEQPFSRTAGGFVYNGDSGQRRVQIGPGRTLADSDPGDRIFARLREGNGQVVAEPASGNSGEGVMTITNTESVASYNYETFAVNFVAPDAYEVRDSGGVLIASGAFSEGDSISIGDLNLRVDGQPAAGDSFALRPSQQTDVFSVIERIASELEAGTPGGRTTAAFQSAIDAGLNGLDKAMTAVLTARTDTGIRLGVADSQRDTNASAKLILQESLSQVEDLDYAAAISALTQQATALEAAQQTFVRVQGLSLFNYL